MKIDQFDVERRKGDSPGDRPWRKHATPLNKPPSDPNYPKSPFNRDEWMKSSKPMEEGSDVPVPGDTIRTPKLEGKVSKVEEGYVYFTTADGRNMRNTVENCTVIEKLADQECDMCEDEQIDEISNEVLAKYKTAAGKDASAADKKGDYARGNKRFSGINTATKKQFDNDAKKRNINEEEVPGEYVKDINGWQGDAKSYGFTVKRNGDNFIATNNQGQKVGVWDGSGVGFGVLFNTPQELQSKLQEIQKAGGTNKYSREKYSQEVSDFPAKYAKTVASMPVNAAKGALSQIGVGEGTMGGINRSAPSNDVSYEKVLDRNPQTAHSRVVGEESDKNIVKTFDANAAAKETAGQLATLLNRPSERLTPGMIQFIREFETRVYVDDMGNSCKVVDFLESRSIKSSKQDLNELSVSKLQAYKDAAKSPASFKNRPLRKLARTIQGVQGANDRIKVKTGDQVGKNRPDRGTYESRLAEFVNEIDEAITPWGGYTADDKKAGALAKAPKSQMQGKDDIRFSDLVQDTIRAHGVKDAFEFYVKKHGLPPRQFQIYAGLAVDHPKRERPTPAVSPQPSAPAKKSQSWWQNLRGKLPFE